MFFRMCGVPFPIFQSTEIFRIRPNFPVMLQRQNNEALFCLINKSLKKFDTVCFFYFLCIEIERLTCVN